MYIYSIIPVKIGGMAPLPRIAPPPHPPPPSPPANHSVASQAKSSQCPDYHLPMCGRGPPPPPGGGRGRGGPRESEERERAERGALQLVRVQLPALRGSCHCQCLQPSCLLPGLAASSGRVPCCFQAAVGLSGALLCLLPSRIPARCDLRSTLLPACSPVCDFLATAVH